METKLKYSLTLIMGLLSSLTLAQFGIGGGLSTLLEFGNKKPFVGMNFSVEVPRNNRVVFYGRASYLFRQNNEHDFGTFTAVAKDINTEPQWLNVGVNYLTSVDYITVDGGTRYYLINGFDEGFSLYGGTNLGLIVNNVKYGTRVEKFDEEKYMLNSGDFSTNSGKGAILRMAIGFTGGMKYTVPRIGTFFFDVNPYITVFGIPSNTNIPSSVYKSVAFNFNIGYRKEIYR